MDATKKKSIYRRFALDCKDLPLFQQPWYLDAVSENGSWDVALSMDSEGNVQAAFPYFLKSNAGIRHITMPHLTPYLGPYLTYPKDDLKNTSLHRYEKNVMLDLAVQIPDVILHKTHCHPNLKNALPFAWRGYELLVRYTYILKKNTEEQLWLNLDSKQRNIVKGAKDNLKVEEWNDIEAFFLLNEKSFTRKSDHIPYDIDFFKRLDNALMEKKSRLMLKAIDEGQKVYAGIYIVFDRQSAYCLCIGSEPDLVFSGAVPLLIWEGILRSFEKVGRFNFEGGMIPNIERIFRSFGGDLVSYYKLRKSRNRLAQSILTLINKI